MESRIGRRARATSWESDPASVAGPPPVGPPMTSLYSRTERCARKSRQRRDFGDERAEPGNTRNWPGGAIVTDSLRAMLAVVREQISETERAIEAFLRTHPELGRKVRLPRHPRRRPGRKRRPRRADAGARRRRPARRGVARRARPQSSGTQKVARSTLHRRRPTPWPSRPLHGCARRHARRQPLRADGRASARTGQAVPPRRHRHGPKTVRHRQCASPRRTTLQPPNKRSMETQWRGSRGRPVPG